MKLTNKSPVFRITFIALNIALYYVLSLVSINLQAQVITFKGLPIVLTSIAAGPLDGAIVAGIGELISQATGAYGLTPTTPLWILPHVVRALIVGFMMNKKDFEKNKNALVLSVILSGIAVTILNSIVIYLDALIFEYPAALTIITIATRAAASITTSIIYVVVVPLLLTPLKKANKITSK